MARLSIWVLVFAALSAPGIVLAAGGRPEASNQWLAFASLMLNTWIASKVPPLEKRVSALEVKR